MPITLLPDPPSRQEPSTFSAKSDAFLGALPTFGTEANALATDVNAKQITASAAAVTAVEAKDAALQSANDAALSETNAAQSASDAELLVVKFQGELAADPALNKTGGPLTAGDWYINTVSGLIRAYNGSAFVNSLNVTAGVTDINGLSGSVGSPSQAEAEAGTEATKPMNALRTAQAIAALAKAKVIRSARTSNTDLGAADSGKWIDITSGTFTQTFSAAAALGDGWWCYLGNSGLGDVTLDPNSTETIDGLLSYVMYPGEVRLVQCDGIALKSIVINPLYTEFVSSGSFIKPPGYSGFQCSLFGGGGSGGKGSSNGYAGGGGGAANLFYVKQEALSASNAVTIGSGGTAPTVANTQGATGGTSSFASNFAYGGAGGGAGADGGAGGGGVTSQGSGSVGGNPKPASTTANGGAYGGGTTGAYSSGDFGGGAGGGWVASTVFRGGFSVYGGGGGGPGSATQYFGGQSLRSGNGGDGSTTGVAVSGSIPSGGGGGTISGSAGNGARGEFRILGVI